MDVNIHDDVRDRRIDKSDSNINYGSYKFVNNVCESFFFLFFN